MYGAENARKVREIKAMKSKDCITDYERTIAIDDRVPIAMIGKK